MANLNKPGDLKINTYEKKSPVRRATKAEHELMETMKDGMAMAKADLERIYKAKCDKLINYEMSDEAKRMKGRISTLHRLINSKIFSKAGRKKQKTRLLKVGCASCGYVTRITITWIEVGIPCCPNKNCEKVGQPFEVEWGQIESQSDDGDARNIEILENVEALRNDIAAERTAGRMEQEEEFRSEGHEMKAILEESDKWLDKAASMFGGETSSEVFVPVDSNAPIEKGSALNELIKRGLIQPDHEFPASVRKVKKGEVK